MNDFEFYHTIKQIDPSVNICTMTAYGALPADKHSDNSAIPFDPKFVLKKPFDSEQMLAKFREIMKDKH